MPESSFPETLSEAPPRLPLSGLLALACAGFITILTEALPAGLLPMMSADLGVSASLIGQLVTLYAIGSLLAAIPLTVATRGWRRRPLLMTAIAGFAVVNAVTAFSSSYAVILMARFFAGVFAGLLWALLAGHASRMVAAPLQGRAIAVAMVGTPLALSLGIPAGTLLGSLLGWRMTFAGMTLLTLALLVWVRVKVPDFAAQPAERRLPVARVLAMPGGAVLLVTLGFVLAHNVLYTYIAPLLQGAGMQGQLEPVLLLFGISALLGIWLIGVLIDRWLREMVLATTALFLGAAVVLGMSGQSSLPLLFAVAIWGLAFGGAATLFQTASARTAGDSADVAQSMIVTTWNLGIAGGGLLGGVLLDRAGAGTLAWAVAGLLAITLWHVWRAKVHGFPATKV